MLRMAARELAILIPTATYAPKKMPQFKPSSSEGRQQRSEYVEDDIAVRKFFEKYATKVETGT